MKETTALNRISKIIDNINYETAYIEIQTKSDKYTLNKENRIITLTVPAETGERYAIIVEAK